jgi:hypothetical protein
MPMAAGPKIKPIILKAGRGETKPRLAAKFKEVAKAYMAGQQSVQQQAAPPQAPVEATMV